MTAWPNWPVQTVKRPRWDLGLLAEVDGRVEPRVYRTNLFQGIKPDTEILTYDTFDALIADGWHID